MLTPQQVIINELNARWWLFTHIGIPTAFVAIVVYFIYRLIYENYYDN